MRASLLVVAVGCSLSGAAALSSPGQLASLRSERKPPSFPVSYEVHYNFTLPYTATFLDKPLSFPAKLYIDDINKLYKIDVYDGLDTELNIAGVDYLVGPRFERQICLVNGETPGGPSGPSLANAAPRAAAPPVSLGKGALPDLANWTFAGDVQYNGRPAEKWAFNQTDELKTSAYEFTLTPEGVPLYMHMLGSEVLTDSHFDEYEAVFTAWIPGPIDGIVFEIPSLCDAAQAHSSYRSHAVHLALLNPFARLARSEYDGFHTEHNREHTGMRDYSLRNALYLHHSMAIKQHNLNPNALYKMGVNRFADWTDAEYGSLLGYRSSRLDEAQDSKGAAVAAVGDDGDDGELTHKPHRKYGKHKHKRRYKVGKGFQPAPASIDWRTSGAVGVVKDQSVCGSCWTFSASQAMSAAWWLATGDFVSLAEQQMMDCAWEYGYNGGCDGGDPDLAMLYVIENGGGAYSESAWPYRGEDDHCKVDADGGQLHGLDADPSSFFSKVYYIDQYDAEGVRQAIYHNGPISIAIDANPTAFRFYTSGVIANCSCGSKPEDLDHAILAVGYGEEAGEPYWLVKNEWSAHWGDGGYAKISRKQGHDCGVATAAVFPVADVDAAKDYMHRKHKREKRERHERERHERKHGHGHGSKRSSDDDGGDDDDTVIDSSDERDDGVLQAR